MLLPPYCLEKKNFNQIFYYSGIGKPCRGSGDFFWIQSQIIKREVEIHLFMHIIAEPLTTTLSTNLALLFSQILSFYFFMITCNFQQEPVMLSPRMYMWIFSIIWYLPGQHNPASTGGSWWVLLLLHLKDYLYSFQNNYYCVLIMWKITKGVLCPN